MNIKNFKHRFVRPAVIILAAMSLCFFSNLTPASNTAAQKRSPRRRAPKVPPPPKIDYTNFSHSTHVVTQKLACNSCHKVPSKNWNVVRKGDAAFPDVTDFPEHAACLECHRTQFFARERPAPAICANCHIAVTPRDTARWLFPSLGDVSDPKLKMREATSEFGVGFPHDKHLDAIGMYTPANVDRVKFTTVTFQAKKPAPPKSCPICHETYRPQGNSSEEYLTKPPRDIGDNFWLKKGTFKTIPNNHAKCFECHNADSGIPPEPKNCETCHKLLPLSQSKTDFDVKLAASMGADKIMLARWRRRISSGGFRHEGGEHPDINCLNCHKVESATFNTVDPKTMRVPVTSCGGADGCHITQTASDGGALNFEIDSKRKDPKFVCTKCHVVFGNQAIPDSHPRAIPTPRPKASP